jgi:hypothetical protein
MFQKRKRARQLAEQNQREHDEARQHLIKLTAADGSLSPDGFVEFIEFATERDLHLDSMPDVLVDARLGLAHGGYFLETETKMPLHKEETALLETPVALLKEVKDRQYVGGSRGISVPLGGGMRYRAGAYRGHMETIATHWEQADAGLLTLTDQRAVYHGARKTLEFLYSKLATLNVYADAIDLGVTNRQTTSSFATELGELIAGVVQDAIAHQDSGVTIIHITFQDNQTQ